MNPTESLQIFYEQGGWNHDFKCATDVCLICKVSDLQQPPFIEALHRKIKNQDKLHVQEFENGKYCMCILYILPNILSLKKGQTDCPSKKAT